MGVDPRRPLAGFVFVAVLCAVLMTITISRGFGVDLVHPGRPISGQPARTPADPPAERSAAPESATIPDELSAQPLAAVVAGGPGPGPAQEGNAVSGGDSDGDSSRISPGTTGDAQSTRATTTTAKAERTRALKALRDAAKAQRAAERDAAKAQRAAERDAAKAQRAAERDAAKAARKG